MKTGLLWRVLTALVLVPLFLWVVWLAPLPVLPLFLAAVFLLGAWEWSRLMGLGPPPLRAGYTALNAVLMLLSWVYLARGLPAWPVVAAGVVWWLVALTLLRRFSRDANRGVRSRRAAGLAGVLIIVPAWFAVVALHRDGPYGAYWVTVLLLLVWGSDIGGYAAGRCWGRRKMAPAVSPGKTWEGAAGSLVLGLIAAGAMHMAGLSLGFAPVWPVWFLVLPIAIAAIVFGIVGDLFESMMKRQRGLKDSGTLLPGHGGVLDRIDALVAAAPVLALGLQVHL